jgi:hypothetical protein
MRATQLACRQRHKCFFFVNRFFCDHMMLALWCEPSLPQKRYFFVAETRATSVFKECLRKESVKHILCNTHGVNTPAVHLIVHNRQGQAARKHLINHFSVHTETVASTFGVSASPCWQISPRTTTRRVSTSGNPLNLEQINVTLDCDRIISPIEYQTREH